jgi:hypothetical protein
MAQIKLADAVGRLNDRYDAALTYQRLYMLGLQRRIPVARDETGRFWVVDKADLPRIAKTPGLTAAKPKSQPGTKNKPAAKPKPAPVKPARSRSTRSAA